MSIIPYRLLELAVTTAKEVSELPTPKFVRFAAAFILILGTSALLIWLVAGTVSRGAVDVVQRAVGDKV